MNSQESLKTQLEKLYNISRKVDKEKLLKSVQEALDNAFKNILNIRFKPDN